MGWDTGIEPCCVSVAASNIDSHTMFRTADRQAVKYGIEQIIPDGEAPADIQD